MDKLKVIAIKPKCNQSALHVLRETIKKVESGEVVDIGISWVTSDKGIGGDGSEGGDLLLMWAALEHHAKSFYNDFVDGGPDGD